MTATGPRPRLWTSLGRSCRRKAPASKNLDERRRKLWSLPFLLVLEVHEHLVPISGAFFDARRPALQIGRVIPLVAKAKVPMAGRRPDRRGLVAEVRDAERRAVGLEPRVHGVREPGVVTKLERAAQVTGQRRQKVGQSIRVGSER